MPSASSAPLAPNPLDPMDRAKEMSRGFADAMHIFANKMPRCCSILDAKTDPESFRPTQAAAAAQPPPKNTTQGRRKCRLYGLQGAVAHRGGDADCIRLEGSSDWGYE